MSDKKEKKITKEEMAYKTAKALFKELYYINIGGTFYEYVDGCWDEINHQYAIANVENMYFEKFGLNVNNAQVKEITRALQTMTINEYGSCIDARNTCDFNEVYLYDDILDLDTFQIKEYDRDMMVFSKLPFNYNPTLKPSKTFQNFLVNVFNDGTTEGTKQTIEFIQEFIGYTLMPANPFEKALIMHGGGRNGKGTLIHIWRKLLGESNVSDVDLGGINDEKKICMLKHKMVNFSPDLDSGQQIDTGNIKSLTSNETITVRDVFKSAESLRFTGKLVIATNEMPFIRNISTAVSERLIIVDFKNTFSDENGKKDPYLKQKLEADIEGIFSWAIEGLKRLKKRGRFVIPKTSMESLEYYLYENDPIRLWMDENNVEKEGVSCRTKDVYLDYKHHCSSSGKRPIGKIKFYETMEKRGYPIKKTNGERFFEGISIS